MKGNWIKWAPYLPAVAALAAAAALAVWWNSTGGGEFNPRLPGADQAPPGESGGANPVLAGKLIPGPGQPAELPGAWPQFRGPGRDGICPNPSNLSRDWSASPPRELWSVEVGEGYAGPAVRDGRVYLMDYDRPHKQSTLRCLSLADGKELWHFDYPLTIKRNHGMTRTTPALADKYVVAMDSKCNVICLDAVTGELRWSISLVRDYGATVPQWYTGQCPLIETNVVMLAPGGPKALLLAVDLATGQPLWQTPNPHDWKMTHSSVMPMDLGGRHFYVYCGSGGVVGVDAKDGSEAWETSAWKISIATVPSPLVLDDGRVFFSGGYGAGSLMLKLEEQNAKLTPQTVFKLAPEVFGATQHTPIFKDGFLYGVRPDGQFVCLETGGKPVWASGTSQQFGLGPFLLAGNVIFAMNDNGKLSLIEASPARFNLLGQAQPLNGRESWGPMALAGNRLLVRDGNEVGRDSARLVCLDVGAK